MEVPLLPGRRIRREPRASKPSRMNLPLSASAASIIATPTAPAAPATPAAPVKLLPREMSERIRMLADRL